MVARNIFDAVFGRPYCDMRAGEDGGLGECRYGCLPCALALFSGFVVEEFREGFSLGIRKDVHVEKRDSCRVVLHFAFELDAAGEVGGGVEIEAGGEVGRQAVEGPAPLAQRGVAACALLDAEFRDRRRHGVEGRFVEAGDLRHCGVEEDGRRVALGVGGRPDHAHAAGVPDLGQAGCGDGEGSADFHFRSALGPGDAPGPFRRFRGENGVR